MTYIARSAMASQRLLAQLGAARSKAKESAVFRSARQRNNRANPNPAVWLATPPEQVEQDRVVYAYGVRGKDEDVVSARVTKTGVAGPQRRRRTSAGRTGRAELW